MDPSFPATQEEKQAAVRRIVDEIEIDEIKIDYCVKPGYSEPGAAPTLQDIGNRVITIRVGRPPTRAGALEAVRREPRRWQYPFFSLADYDDPRWLPILTMIALSGDDSVLVNALSGDSKA